MMRVTLALENRMKRFLAVVLLLVCGCAARQVRFIDCLTPSNWTPVSDTVSICSWPIASSNLLLSVFLSESPSPGAQPTKLYEATSARVLNDTGHSVVLEMHEVDVSGDQIFSTNIPTFRYELEYTIRSQQKH
jgi:hypothetical protein